MKKTALFLLSALYLFSNQAHPNIVENIRKAVYDLDFTKPMCESSIDYLLKPRPVQKYMNDFQMGTIKMPVRENPKNILENNGIKRYWFSCFPELIHQEIMPLHNVFQGLNTEFNLIAQLRDNLFAISSLNTIFIYDHNKGTLQPISNLESPVYLIIPINYGLQFATCSCDSIIKIWDVLNAQCIATFQAHNASIEKIFDTGNNTIMSFCKGELKATEWSHYGKILADYEFKSEQNFNEFIKTIPGAILSDKYCSSMTADETITLYDYQLNEAVGDFEGNINTVKLFANNLISSLTDEGIKLSDPKTKECIHELKMLYCNEALALVSTQNGDILFILYGQLYCWSLYPAYLQELSLDQGALIIQLLLHKNEASISLHPDWYELFDKLPCKFKMIYLEQFIDKIAPLSSHKRKKTPVSRLPSAKKFCTQSEC